LELLSKYFPALKKEDFQRTEGLISNSSENYLHPRSLTSTMGFASQDKCPAPCYGLLILFFMLFFIGIFSTFALNIASQSAALR
jgi:hypothetical protein